MDYLAGAGTLRRTGLYPKTRSGRQAPETLGKTAFLPDLPDYDHTINYLTSA